MDTQKWRASHSASAGPSILLCLYSSYSQPLLLFGAARCDPPLNSLLRNAWFATQCSVGSRAAQEEVCRAAMKRASSCSRFCGIIFSGLVVSRNRLISPSLVTLIAPPGLPPHRVIRLPQPHPGLCAPSPRGPGRPQQAGVRCIVSHQDEVPG